MSVGKIKITTYMKNNIRDKIYSMYAKKDYVTIANYQLNDKMGEHFNASISANENIILNRKGLVTGKNNLQQRFL